MSTLISPITRRRIAALSLALLPAGAWIAAATWGSHMHWRDWDARTFRHFVLLTPQYPLLYYALGIGLVLALVLILFVGRTARTEGFEGAAYNALVPGRVPPLPKTWHRIATTQVNHKTKLTE